MFDSNPDLDNASSLVNTPEIQSYLSDLRQCRERGFPDEVERFFWWRIARSKSRGAWPDQLVRFDEKAPDDAEIFRLTNYIVQGGGTLGLAHAGYLYGMEEAGIRFPCIAGTSAGAIVALGLVALRGADITNSTQSRVLPFVENAPLDEFIDGQRQVRKLIKKLLHGRSILSASGAWQIARALKRILTHRGLNPGDAFEDWLETEFRKFGLRTNADLDALLEKIADQLCNLKSTCPSPFVSDDEKLQPNEVLKVISSAMPAGVKFRFPEDLTYLDTAYRTSSPAILVRMSMAVPFFFEPVVMKTNRAAWSGGKEGYVEKYLDPLLSEGTLRELSELGELTFFDGGLYSNLPFDVFELSVKDFPTLSVPLVNDRPTEPPRRVSSPKTLVKEIVSVVMSLKTIRDRDIHMARSRAKKEWNPSGVGPLQGFPLETTKIDTGEVHWLNFNMSEDDKAALFLSGLKRAHKFLTKGPDNV